MDEINDIYSALLMKGIDDDEIMELEDVRQKISSKDGYKPTINNIGQVHKIFDENRMRDWLEGPRNFYDHYYCSAIKHEFERGIKYSTDLDSSMLNVAKDYRDQLAKLDDKDRFHNGKAEKLNSILMHEITKTHQKEMESNPEDRETLAIQHKFEKAYFTFRLMMDEKALSSADEVAVSHKLIEFANVFNQVRPEFKDKADKLKSIEHVFQSGGEEHWWDGMRDFYVPLSGEEADCENFEKKNQHIYKHYASKMAMERKHHKELKASHPTERTGLFVQHELERAFLNYRKDKALLGLSNTLEHHDQLEESKKLLIKAYEGHINYQKKTNPDLVKLSPEQAKIFNSLKRAGLSKTQSENVVKSK